MNDPILAELRQIRATINEECHSDLELLVCQIEERKRQRLAGKSPHVTASPPPPDAETETPRSKAAAK